MKTILPAMAAIAVLSMASARAQQPAGGACPGAYVIGLEDVLDVAVWGNPDLTRTVPVRPDGKISLPLLNDVTAAGLSPMELRDALIKALTEFMPQPSVSVVVREIHSVKVSVIGEVKTAGRYELKDRATVLDVLAMAGGLSEFAERNHIVILRQGATGTERIPIPYDKLTAKSRAQNVCVHPGDIVFVP
ncbi:MAG TPA: polysaccharide biosynthesis/export family protein [Vicinamibacterales bacterium]|nr:polysaccharide biosynthesis/export family protein [Vicinamibacterales bacterium]